MALARLLLNMGHQWMQEEPIMASDLSEVLLELALCAVLPYVLVAALDRVAGKPTVHPKPGSHQNGEPHP